MRWYVFPGQREPGCQYQVQGQEHYQTFPQKTLQGNVKFWSTTQVFGQFTFRSRSRIVYKHEGFNLEVLICKVMFYKTLIRYLYQNITRRDTYCKTLPYHLSEADYPCSPGWLVGQSATFGWNSGWIWLKFWNFVNILKSG